MSADKATTIDNKSMIALTYQARSDYLEVNEIFSRLYELNNLHL